MSTASDTLTINTNCSAGYSVYVSAINGGDTNLTNDSASAISSGNNTITASSATVGGTSTVLSPNTWGINANSADVSENKYFGLPSYSSATTTALTTKADVETSSTVPIYYGAKVTTAIAPGTYSGDVLYTVLSNPSCSTYTIVYNANGGTGEMDNQTINVGQATTLSENTFEREGYTFLGWSNTADGKTGTAVDGIGTVDDVDYEDEASVTDISGFNTTKTLYAIWEVTADGDMQTWTGCSTLSIGQSVKLKDTRDDKIYAVKKLPDNKCWMMQNLTIGSEGSTASQRTLTPANTNIDNNTTYYLPPAGKQGSSTIDDSSTLTATDTANFTENSTIDQHAKTQFRAKGYRYNSSAEGYANDSDTGYYNFYTATLGFSYYDDGKSSGSSTRDICPRSWKLPWISDNGFTSNTSGYFQELAKAYNPNAVWETGSGSFDGYKTTDSTVRTGMLSGVASPSGISSQNNYAGFSYSGSYSGLYLYNVGAYGYHWSSSVFGTKRNPSLHTESSYISPNYSSGNTSKSFGFAVRCLAQNNYTVNYNANGGTGAASKASDSIYETGEVTTANQGTLAKEGYNFLGWSLDQNATTATYNANTAVSVPSLISAASSPASGSTITLYAVWEERIDGDMQTWTGCASLSTGQSRKLRDTRDNTIYVIKKLSDGKCWMIENLTISATGMVVDSLDNTNTNIPSNDSTKYYLPPRNTRYATANSITNSAVKTASGSLDFSSGNSNQPQIGYKAVGSTDNSTGNPVPENTAYYPYYTASLGFSYYGGSSSGSSPRDICPKGWRLPWTSDAGTTRQGSAEFYALALTYNSNSSVWTNYIAPGSTGSSGPSTSSAVVRNNMISGDANSIDRYGNNGAAGFTYAGRYRYTAVDDVGTYGYYLSSSVYNNNFSYHISFDTTYVRPQHDYHKFIGLAVRCIAKDTMQSTSASALPESATTSLVDSRDGQSYSVYRWPSTGTAGTDYPTGMAGYAIMAEDLSLGYITGGSVTRGADLNLDTSTSVAFGTIIARTGTSDWDRTNNSSNLQYANGPKSGSGTYSSHSYYSFGAAQKVCPKGWTLPTQAQYNKIATFMGGDNSTGSSKIRRTPYNFTYGGTFYSGGWEEVGSAAYYWSSSEYDTNRAYTLYFTSTRLITNHPDKYLGKSVRCIASF